MACATLGLSSRAINCLGQECLTKECEGECIGMHSLRVFCVYNGEDPIFKSYQNPGRVEQGNCFWFKLFVQAK